MSTPETIDRTTSAAIADRQTSNIDLIESHVMDKIKISRNQLDKLEQVVKERSEQIRGKIEDLTEISNTVLNATNSLSSTIEGLLAHELKPL